MRVIHYRVTVQARAIGPIKPISSPFCGFQVRSRRKINDASKGTFQTIRLFHRQRVVDLVLLSCWCATIIKNLTRVIACFQA